MKVADVHPLVNECFARGILLLQKSRMPEYAPSIVPITTRPSRFPAVKFNVAVDHCTLFNEMVDILAQQPAFFSLVQSVIADADPFMSELLKVYHEAARSAVKSPITLGFNRCDFMSDVDGGIYQVEMNTLSVSLAELALRVSAMFRDTLPHANIPPNSKSSMCLPLFVTGVDEYCRIFDVKPCNCAVLFVVQPFEANRFDQLHLEMALAAKGITVFRATFEELASSASSASFNWETGAMCMQNREIAVVYYRAGYDPSEYGIENAWSVRTDIEKCRAAKLPSVGYQLIGKKIVQTLLRNDAVFKRFLPDTKFGALKQFFTGLWLLDSVPPAAAEAFCDGQAQNAATYAAECHAAVEDAIAHPERYVLKPQRDGGGHNIWGNAVRESLLNSAFSRKAHILMRTINVECTPNEALRHDLTSTGPILAVGELGVYGCFCRIEDQTSAAKAVACINSYAGYLLRTKDHTSNEGGIMAGFGFLDAPELHD